jgi:hypothetical protein
MRYLEMLQQQQPMMTGPMMLAQNLVNPAKMKGTGVLDERGTYVGDKPAPVNVDVKSTGGSTPQWEIDAKKAQEDKSKGYGRTDDLYYLRLKEKYPRMPEAELIKRSSEKRASGQPPIY